MSKICTNCAQELSDNATVCNMCGEQLSVINNNVPQSHEPSSRPLYEEPVEAPNHNDTYCKICGAKLNPNNAFCAKCGATVTAKKPIVSKPDTPPQNTQKKTKRIIIAFSAVVSAVVLLIAVYFGLSIFKKNDSTVNNTIDFEDVKFKNISGEAIKTADGVTYEDNNYLQLDEKYTDRKITDAQSAIDSLSDVADLLDISDVDNEFELKSQTSIGGINYYRLSQVYRGIPVYGQEIVVIADDDGMAEGLTSSYRTITNLDVSATISEYEAKEIAVAYITETWQSDDSVIEIVSVEQTFLCLVEEEQPLLSWMVSTQGLDESGMFFSYVIFVNAKNSEVIGIENRMYSTMEEIRPKGQLVTQKITVRKEGNTYTMCNFTLEDEREMSGHPVDLPVVVLEVNKGHKKDWADDVSEYTERVSWTEDKTPNPSAVDAFANVSFAAKFYRKVLGRNSWDNEGSATFVFVGLEYKPKVQNEDNGTWKYEWIGVNAYSGNGNISFYKPSFLNSFKQEYSAYLDIVAHEFTHNVFSSIVGSISSNNTEGDALNEAYADMMGKYVEDYLPGFSTDWIYGSGTPTERDLRKDISMDDYIFSGKDTQYENSKIISHTAYLMWNGGKETGEWERIKDTELLANLWYRALLIMHSNVTFSQCRSAVELEARIMVKKNELTQLQYNTVVKAFDTVGIKKEPTVVSGILKDEFNLTVLNYEGAPTNYYDLKLEYLGRTPLIKAEPVSIFEEKVRDYQYCIRINDYGYYLLTVSNYGSDNGVPISVYIQVRITDDDTVDELIIQTDSSRRFTVIPDSELYMEGTVADISEPEKEKLIKLLSFADPAGEMFRVSSTNNIDNEMFFAGILAGYTGYADYEYDFHSVTLPESLSFLDEANTYRINRMTMQSIIKGIYGREMNAPEKHERYYNGYFYFSHWDITHFGGVRHTVDEVYTLSNDYYRITGIAHRYDYGPDIDPIASEVYTAVVKKDTDATHDYYLVAIEYGESGTLEDINREIINAGNTGSSQDSQVDIYAIYDEYLTSKKWQLIDSFSNEMSIDDKTYIDLDSDGIDELLITASTGIDYGDSSASALLAIVNNEVVCSLSAWTLNTSGSQQEQLMIVVEDSSNKPFLAKKGFRNAWGDYGSTLVVYNFSNGTVSERRSFIEMSTGNIDEIKAETNLVYPSYDEYSIMFYMIDGDYVTDAHYKQEASFYVES